MITLTQLIKVLTKIVECNLIKQINKILLAKQSLDKILNKKKLISLGMYFLNQKQEI